MPTLGGVNSKNLVYSSKVDIDKELTKVNPIKALASGLFTTADIGKTVYLSNSLTVCQEWRIAGINHDGTSGTVDLISKYTLLGVGNEITYVSTYNNSYTRYEDSNVRSKLLSIYNGFSSEIQNASVDTTTQTSSWNSNGGGYIYSVIHDKIKAPSCTELGVATDYYPSLSEGSAYEIFGGKISTTYSNGRCNPLAIMRSITYKNNADDPYISNRWAVRYWTRTYYTWCMSTNGESQSMNNNSITGSSKYDIVAIIRFGKK